MQLASAMLNSLALEGSDTSGVNVLHPTGGGSFGLSGLLFTGSGGPAATLGFTGDYYLDLTAGVLYKKV